MKIFNPLKIILRPFKGRRNRHHFIIRSLVYFIIWVVVFFVCKLFILNTSLNVVIILAHWIVLVMKFVISILFYIDLIKRVHDFNLSPTENIKFPILYFIVYVSVLVFPDNLTPYRDGSIIMLIGQFTFLLMWLVIAVKKGDPHPNRFGDSI